MVSPKDRVKRGRASYRYIGEFPKRGAAEKAKVVIGKGVNREELKKCTAWQRGDKVVAVCKRKNNAKI